MKLRSVASVLFVSVLFNEPKLLKFRDVIRMLKFYSRGFSALQRAEIAEIQCVLFQARWLLGFSALQRAEIAEIEHLQRQTRSVHRFSALQRAEIAEMQIRATMTGMIGKFQCSSTSRNC